ncbi:hypothetical protein SMF913_29184 [Streptomyces malaysiensis]|uniref:Uncharacterized protein n=1 Tax=Streptomyces malaysiensis TaxID=92644 RepID=A0A2J7Z0N9_STRMQ|nr:hypothetical protein SMF913_29184 [Streptomyces malaysiensis]
MLIQQVAYLGYVLEAAQSAQYDAGALGGPLTRHGGDGSSWPDTAVYANAGAGAPACCTRQSAYR